MAGRDKITTMTGARKRALPGGSPLILLSTDSKVLLGYSSSEATLETCSAGTRHQTLAGVYVDQAVHLAQFDDFLLIGCFINGGPELLESGAHGSTVLAVALVALFARNQAFLTTFMVWHLT